MNEACPLPDPSQKPQSAVRRMLRGQRVAVVGLSDDPSRASYGVAAYLKSVGKEILPVNPNCKTILGVRCYPSLEAVPGPIDVVDVFRRPEFCAEVARSAAAVGAKGVWLQSGITNDEAQDIARRAGMDFVQDRCMKVDHMLMGAQDG